MVEIGFNLVRNVLDYKLADPKGSVFKYQKFPLLFNYSLLDNLCNSYVELRRF